MPDERALTTELMSHAELVDHEAVIERGQQTFVEVGLALVEIRDRRGYRTVGFATFEDYIRERWGKTRQWGYYLMQAASFAQERMSTGVDIPESEREARRMMAEERHFAPPPVISLAALPAEEHAAVRQLIEQPGIPPDRAAGIVEHLAQTEPAERQHVYQLNASPDDRERALALSTAAGTPPLPDPRMIGLLDMRRTIRGWLHHYPEDPHNDALEGLIVHIEATAEAIHGRKVPAI